MSAILKGLTGFTPTVFVEGPAGSLPGHLAGFTVSVLCKITTQTGSDKVLFAQRESHNASLGWEICTLSTNATMVFSVGSATGNASAQVSITKDDINKLLLVTGVWAADASPLAILYMRRNLCSQASLSAGVYTPTAATAKPSIGHNSLRNYDSGSSVVIYGVYYAPGIARISHIYAQHDAVVVTERIQPCPGMPGTLIDLTADIEENGGSLPTTFKNRSTAGVDFISASGIPAISPQYARHWG